MVVNNQKLTMLKYLNDTRPLIKTVFSITYSAHACWAFFGKHSKIQNSAAYAYCAKKALDSC